MKVKNSFSERARFRFLVVLGGCLLASQCFAHDFELEASFGLDSNPNKVMKTLDTEDGVFGIGRFEFSHTPAYSGYYYELESQSDLYQTNEVNTNEGNAERFTSKAELGYKWRPRTKYGLARFKFELNYHLKDSIFVDRSTGDVAVIENGTYAGEEIGDRFDADWTGVKFQGDVPISAEAFFLYDLKIKTKDYESYEQVGLSNLDYTEGELDIGFLKEVWPKTSLETTVIYGKRFYDDRRAKTEQGSSLPDTDLEYTFLGAVNTIEYDFNRRWKWKVGLDLLQREDNEDGYYDMTMGQLFTRVVYRNKDYVRFVFYASYMKRDYTELEDDPATVDEEIKAREGFNFRAEVVRQIFGREYYTFDLVMGVRYETYDNSNPVFAYDRSRTYVGIRWRPY